MTRTSARRVRTTPREVTVLLGCIEHVVADDGINEHRLNRLRAVVRDRAARGLGPASHWSVGKKGKPTQPTSAPPPGVFSHDVDHEAPQLADTLRRAESERDPVRRRRLLALAEEDVDRLDGFGTRDRVRGDFKRGRDERILTYAGWPSDRVARVEDVSRQTVDAIRRGDGRDPKTGLYS